MSQAKYQLSQKWINILKRNPESGMGFQITRITTLDGCIYSNVMIAGKNTIVGIYDNNQIPFSVEEIANIHVTHLQKPHDFDPKKWFYVKE